MPVRRVALLVDGLSVGTFGSQHLEDLHFLFNYTGTLMSFKLRISSVNICGYNYNLSLKC